MSLKIMVVTRQGSRQKIFSLARVRVLMGGDEMSKRTEIKADLISQLERNCIYGKHYLDLIEDYMALWDIKNCLIKDIKARGVSVEYIHGSNQKGFKKNDSIGELNKTNAQMLKILNELGLKASGEMFGDDEL